MGKSNRISLSIFSVLLVISVLWKPISGDDKCAIGCNGPASGASYLTGHKYNYGVEGTVAVYLTGADKQETAVRMLGQASVTAVGNCVYELTVQNLAVSGPDGKKYSSPPGIEKPMRFTLQDGRLGPDVCSEPGDTHRSLNIKRAIVSLLQTHQKSSTLVDVFGACPTDVTSSQEGAALLLHQTRDLSRCAHREQSKNGLVTAIYNPTAEVKDTQVLQSVMNIESKVNSGVPEKVAASEEYLYRPFSVGENGARAKVLTKLTLTGKSAGAPTGAACTERRTIIFEAPHVSPVPNNADSALSAVKEAAKTLAKEASSKSATNFVQLIKVFQTTNNADLKKVFSQVKGNSLERRVFLDGLLRTGTGDSIEASIDILKANELSPLESYLVYISLGNAKHVDDDAVKAAVSLMDLPNVPKEIFLGVGALAGTYCKQHNCHSGKAEGIKSVTQKFAAKLNCKAKSKVEEDRTVAILKGIRSIRHLEDSILDKLVHCAVDKDVKARVKVAALEAFHADPCATKIHKTAMDLMKNRQLDSEIRIKAYLAVIECPCGKSATEIKNLLESEPIHQVGRFITTSLRHIRSSTNPDKSLARHHYGQIRTPNKFNVDNRKYSFYREGSFNIDALGLGGNIEETVIYSQDSFLPRSASFNLTTELFGHSLNVFEFGGRQGNLDRVLEHLFGPGSDIRTKDPQTIYDNFMKRWEESSKKVQDGLARGKRSVKTEVDNMHKNIKGESTTFHDELDLDVYVKLFGTDAIFLSLGDDKGLDINKLIDETLKFANTGINNAKHFQKEIRSHMLFLDAELSYPTSTGFPLQLSLIGAATGRLELSTNFDLRQIFKSPESAKVDIKMVPSMNVELIGVFYVNADSVLTGLKVNTNLHSSTGAHIIAKIIENGRGFDLQFGLPVEKQEILTASNELVFLTAEKGHSAKFLPVKVDTDRKEGQFCFDQLYGVLGQTLCGEFSVPFSVSGPEAQASLSKFLARFPLTGPAKINLFLTKEDLRGYHIKGVFRNENNGERRGFELLFDAEGLKNRRTQVSGEFVNSQQEKTLMVGLESPLKTVNAQLSLYTKPSEYVLLMKGKLDAADYYGKIGFNIQGNDRRSVFKPIAEYQLPDDRGKQSLKIDGQLIKEVNGPNTKYSLDNIKVNMPNSNEIIDVNGHYTQEPKGAEIDIKARKGEHNLVLSGSFRDYDLKLLFTNTLNPNVNFKTNGHFQFDKELIHNSLDLYYGGDLTNSQNRMSFNQMWKSVNADSEDKYSVVTKNKFEIYSVPMKLKVDAEVNPKKVEVDVEGLYVGRKGDFKLDSKYNVKKAGDWSVKAHANIDNRGIEVLSKRDIVNNDKSNVENYVEIKNFGKYELSGVVLHKRKPNDVNVGAVGQMKITAGDKKESIHFDIGLIENTKLYSSHAKISTSKGPFLDYLMKLTKGANANGQLKFVLKDTISADGQFKVTDNDGRGNGIIIVDFKKSQRKMKGDVKFVIKDPIVNADVDLFLNFEKDNNDKVHFSTNNKWSNSLIDSKNKLVYAGKNSELNYRRSGVFSGSGKSDVDVEVVLPTERVLGLKFNRDMVIKDNVHDGEVSLLLTDALKRGAEAATITLKSKVINSDFDKQNVHYENKFDMKLKDGRNLQNAVTIKNVPEGDKAKLNFKADITGNLIPKPIHLTGSCQYTSVESIDGTDNYRLKASYGSDIGFEFIGNQVVKVLEEGDRKILDENTLSVRLPFEKAHDIKIVSNFLYVKPKDAKIAAEYNIVESLQINSDVYKIDASGRLGAKEGYSKVKILVPHVDPISLDGNYKSDIEGERKSGKVELKAAYGKGKSLSAIVDAATSGHESSMNIKTLVPQNEKLKKLDLNIVLKKPTPDTLGANIVADMDGKVYKSDWQMVFSKAHPLFDVKSTCPNTGEVSRIYLKGSSLSSSSGKLETKIEKFYGFDLDAESEMNLQKDNVAFKLKADSAKLGWKNYKVDITSKDAGSGKRLEFTATNDNKNILSGSTSFISKQEGQKTIIEGSGSVKLKEEQKSANFKYIRTLLTEGNEQGVETFLNLALGERSYVAESRITNLEYKNSYVYCEEKKQCAHADFNSKINMNQPGVIQHLINVGFDLRKLGFAPEFGLQINNEFSEKKMPQYSLDLHVNKEAKKYHLHVYSQPEHGKFPAGITITLPQRVLAIESLMTYPTSKGLPFPIKGEVFLHLDKNKPQTKTGARFLFDVAGQDKQHHGVAEFAFSHPKLGKEALIRVTGDVAVPTQNSIKIETAAKVSHPTLGNDRESKIYFEANPVLFKLYINTPIVQVIDVEAKATLKDNLQQADVKFSMLQGKPVAARIVAKDFKYYEFTTGYSDESERKLSIIGHIDPEKRIDISADIILPEEKKNIAHGAMFLKDNYIKSDYGISKDNFNYFVNALKKDLSNLDSRIRQLGEKASAEFKNVLSRVEPTLKQLEKAYGDELQKLYEEMNNDQVLKEVSQVLSEITQYVAKLIEDVVKVTKPMIDNVWKAVTETSKKALEMYEKEIEPLVKQLYSNIADLVQEYMNGLIDLLAHFTALLNDFFEKHKVELQELTNTLAEIFKDITRMVIMQLKEMREKSTIIFNELTQQIKEMPFVAYLKEKWQEMTVSDHVMGFLSEMHNTFRNILPTEEIKNFADALFNYVQKKIRMVKVDDAKELRVIYEKYAVALTSSIQFFRAQLNQIGLPNLFNLSPMPLFSGYSGATPVFGGGVSFSAINQLLQGDIPDPIKEFNAYRPRDWNPEYELPPSLRAVVVNGQHFFTFSGRHLTFPGSCRYILAHDYVDNNFTIYIQLQNGAPKGIGIIDRFGTTIELKENGQAALNGANHPFPVYQEGSYAFRLANGRVGAAVKKSAIIFCTPKLEACFIRVNGFYHGKVRGLLGVGNNEPHDDFRMPNGKIASSESEFGNSYRLSSSCAQVKTPEHSEHQLHGKLPAECDLVFGGASPLRPLSLVLDAQPFRQACVHAVAANPKDGLHQACLLAGGYVSLAVTGLLPAAMPSVCLKCTDADSPKNIGDVYDVKLPGKQADIVVTLELMKYNEEVYKKLVVPLVSELVDELKAKQITDIKVYLVGVFSRLPFVDYYDTDLKLKSPKPRFYDESRYEKTPIIRTNNPKIDAAEEYLAKIIDTLKYQFGLHNIVGGYQRIADLPLRPTAVKHSLSLVGAECKNSIAFAVETIRAFAMHQLPGGRSHSHSMVTVTPQLAVGGGKTPEQVVGFSEEGVWYLGEKKESDRSTLKNTDDACIDYIEATDGIVLTSSKFASLSADQQKSYVKTAAAAITSRMVTSPTVHSCVCSYHDAFSARSVCVGKEEDALGTRRN